MGIGFMDFVQLPLRHKTKTSLHFTSCILRSEEKNFNFMNNQCKTTKHGQRKQIVLKWVWMIALMMGWHVNVDAQTASGRIVAFDFSNTSGSLTSRGSQSNNATYVDTSLITKSPSLSNAQNSTVNGNFIVNNYFVSSGWTGASEAQAVALNSYYQFTINPKSGYEFRVDSIFLRWRSALTGVTNVFIRSSWNNYATTIASDTITRNASGFLRLALTAPVTSDTAITIRIYAYGAAAGQSFGIGEKPISTINPDIDVRGRMSTSVPSGTIANGIGATSVCQGTEVWLKHVFTGGTPPYTVYMKDGSGQLFQNSFQNQIDSVLIIPELSWTYTIDSLKDVNGNKSISNSGSATFQVTPNSALAGLGVFTNSQSLSDGAYRTFGNAAQCKSWVRIADSLDGVALGTISTTLQNVASNPFNSTVRFFLPRSVNINSAQPGHATLTFYYTQADFDLYNAQNSYQQKMPLDSNDNENNKSNIRVARTAGSTETPSLTYLEPSSILWNSTKQHWEVTVAVNNSLLNGTYLLTSAFNSTKMVGTISHTAATPVVGSTNASVTIDWADLPGVTQYRFRFRPQGTINWNVSTITGSERIYNFLSFNTTYEVQIRVYESQTQQGEYSQTYTFTTPLSPGKLPDCLTPSISANVIDATTAQLNWSSVSYLHSFQVQLREKNTLTWGGTTTVNNQATFSGLTPNTTYEYRIRTQCENGATDQPFSSYTTIDTFKTPELLLCEMPINLSLVAATANSATVSWSNASNASLYTLQMRVKNTATWGGTSVADTSFTFLNLSPNTTYEFRVRSGCSGAITSTPNSAFSSIAEFTTGSLPLTNCLPPTSINATPSSNSITLTWDGAPNGATYFVQYKPATSAVWGGTSTSNTQFVINNLSANTAYQYRLRTTCVSGTTVTPSSTFSAIGNASTTGLREWQIQSNDGVYPNPTTGEITVVRSNTHANDYNVYLTDITGRLLNHTTLSLPEGSTTWNYSLSAYPRGVYMLRVVDQSGQVYVHKIQRQ